MRVTAGLRALVIWLCVAVLSGAALVGIQRSASPLDDPNPAHERAGYLDSVGPRSAAPLVTISQPAHGKVTAIFFVRTAQQFPLIAALSQPGGFPARADAIVVGGVPNLAESRLAFVTDADGAVARAYGMPRPRDGGYPVGYAIVGPDGTIRYRTLDPGVAGRLREVRTMLAALR